jgi:hypothetical protein
VSAIPPSVAPGSIGVDAQLCGYSLAMTKDAQQQPMAKLSLDGIEDCDSKSASHSSSSLSDKRRGARRAA